MHGDESFKNVAHVSVFLGSINICLTYMLTTFRPNPRHPATDSQSFLFSVNIFSHSAFGGGDRKKFVHRVPNSLSATKARRTTLLKSLH